MLGTHGLFSLVRPYSADPPALMLLGAVPADKYCGDAVCTPAIRSVTSTNAACAHVLKKSDRHDDHKMGLQL